MTESDIEVVSQGMARVSVVVPVHNEADAIGPFLSALDDALDADALNITYEVVFVNDGSRDATERQIELEISKGAAIKLVNLSRNFGK
jgi:polyisoprenyl-phosphate glycosyltransferase